MRFYAIRLNAVCTLSDTLFSMAHFHPINGVMADEKRT